MNKFEGCNGCPDREVYCHAFCEGYQERRAEQDRRIDERVLAQAGAKTMSESEFYKRNAAAKLAGRKKRQA